MGTTRTEVSHSSTAPEALEEVPWDACPGGIVESECSVH